VAILGTVATLAVCEAALRLGRLASPRLRALLYQPTARTELERYGSTAELLAAGYFGYHPYGATRGFTLNSRGFRTREYRDEKAPGTYRVIVLGDSFTFDSSSVPYDWMWHQRAGHLLATDAGRRVEVLSLSAPAVGPRFLLRLWQLEGRHLHPDLVVLGFFVGNDFTDEAGTPLENSESAALARWSYTFRLLRNVVRLQRQARSTAAGLLPDDDGGGKRPGGVEDPDYPARYDDEASTLGAVQYRRVERQRLRLMAGPDAERFSALCADAARVVRDLGRDVEAHGARFIVMLIPDEAQVDTDLRRRLLPTRERQALDLGRPQRCLAAALDEADLPYLDLLPAFRAAAAQRLYRPRDTHWNAAGNRLAGDRLAAFVARRGFGPDSG
jgi:hypothetical protein